MKIIQAQTRVKAKQAVYQHDGVARLGVAAVCVRAGAKQQRCGGQGKKKSMQRVKKARNSEREGNKKAVMLCLLLLLKITR